MGNGVHASYEPYSLRQAQNGNILLFAVRADDGQIRAYKIDQINDASVVNRTFVPRFQVELTPNLNMASDKLSAAPLARLDVPKSAPKRLTNAERKKSSFSVNGPVYLYRCPICQKTFRHKTKDPKLNAHKTKDGRPCMGRMGYYEKTIY